MCMCVCVIGWEEKRNISLYSLSAMTELLPKGRSNQALGDRYLANQQCVHDYTQTPPVNNMRVRFPIQNLRRCRM